MGLTPVMLCVHNCGTSEGQGRDRGGTTQRCMGMSAGSLNGLKSFRQFG